jgi:hypothetical protein
MMKTGHTELDKEDRKIWVTKHPGQVVATISQVYWCTLSEFYITEMSENPLAL